MSIPLAATHVDTTRPHPCLQCSYELGGSPLDGKCPECGKPVVESLAVEDLPVAGSDATIERSHVCPCYKCSYDLRGLRMSGSCPECGTPVAESLRGILLHFADKGYIAQLNSGVSLVLNAILLMVALGVINMFAVFAISQIPGIPLIAVVLLVQMGFLALSIMSCVGYLRLTTPDPGFTGTDFPDTSRRVIRVAVVVQIAISGFQFLLTLVPTPAVTTTNPLEGMAGLVFLVSSLLILAGFVAFIVQFIAMMNYLTWLAKRIPDAAIENRSRRYRWMLPLIAVIGVLALWLGPLIALVMYWNLLDRFRKHTRSILKVGIPAVLKGTHLG